jgi:hypothetical protein
LFAATLAVVSLVAVGCGSGSSGTATGPEQSAYLSAVSLAAPDISTYRTATQLIRMGNAACDGFASGADYEVVADRLALEQGSDPLPAEDLGAVITTAANTLCTQYHDDAQ